MHDDWLNNVTDMEINLENTCRICLENSAIYNIFSSKLHNNVEESCFEVVNIIFTMSMKEADGLPAKVCHECYAKISAISVFRNLAHRSLKKLLEHFCILNNKEEKEEIDLTLKLEDVKEEIIDTNTGPMSAVATALLNFEDCFDNNISSKCLKDCSVMIDEDEFHKFEPPDSPEFHRIDYDDDMPPTDLILSKDSIKKRPTKKGKTITADGDGLVKKKRGRKKKPVTELETAKKEPSICPVCGKFVMNLQDHVKLHDENRKRIACTDCSKTFLTYGARRKHRNRHHLNILYFCKICNKNYLAGDEHNRLAHSLKPKRFQCMECDKKFAVKAQLNYHMTAHTKERPFECEQCGKCFRSRALCNYHRRRDHEGEKSHICQYCSKGFFSGYRLTVHIRSHTKEKLYKCKICEKKFTTTSATRTHELKHTGVKNFKCEICSSTFFNNGALKIHSVSHTKEKKHPCKYCGIKFGRTDHRNRHQLTAHEMKSLN